MGVSILIADDHGLLRAGLRSILNAEAGMLVVGEASDGYEALRKAAELKPDIVLMDISMPNGGGIEATRRIKVILPETEVLILTVHEDEGLMREAIRVGASGYILKRAAETELINAIRAISDGNMYIQSAMIRTLVKNLAPIQSIQHGNLEKLTQRERDVLRLLIRGFTNHQVAEKLQLSQRTVESYRANLMSKLDLHSRIDLMEFAEQNGLLDQDY